MNRKLSNLRDLYLEQGRELYDAIEQEKRELPKIKKRVGSKALKNIITKQMKITKRQGAQLSNLYQNMNEILLGEKNVCCQNIFEKTYDFTKRSLDSEIRDASIINSMQRLKHQKIAGFGSLASYAGEIGQDAAIGVFREILEDEKDIDRELSYLAANSVNKNAMRAKAFAL